MSGNYWFLSSVLGGLIMTLIFFAFAPKPPNAVPFTPAQPVHLYTVGDLVIAQEGKARVGVSPDGWVCYRIDDDHECHRSVPAPEIP